MDDPTLVDRLLRRTLELVTTGSVSRSEKAILAAIRASVSPDGFEVADDEDSVLLLLPRTRRADAPLVLLAGHVDTVPQNAAPPGRRDGDAVIGRGAADMKGALAVMLEVASWVGDAMRTSDVDLGLLFFGREELPITESALLPLFDRCPAVRETSLAIVMEPTANAIEVGCLGNLNATVTVRGVAAHTARPWLGRNAIHAAIDALRAVSELPVRDVEIDGLVYREVASVTSISGGVAGNVVPDLVEAHVNFRYAPSRSPAEAEGFLRELVAADDADVQVIGNAPPGPVVVRNPLVERLRRSGDLAVGPKQAWTPVAEFAMAGVDALNFGPGDPQYAHRDDERVDGDALERSAAVLRAFLAAGEDG